MSKEEFLDAIEKAKSESPERNFNQTVDFIINLMDVDLNNPDEKVDFFLTAPNDMKMDRSICAFVGPELKDEAEKVCDEVVEQDKFDDFDKKESKKLAKRHDFFIAQANIMPDVATAFGKYLGPQGKMPNPNAGSVVPPNASLKPLYNKLQNTIHVQTKNDPVIHVVVGKEGLSEEELADNAHFVYDQLVHKLPKEDNNVKDAYLKLTMGTPVKVK